MLGSCVSGRSLCRVGAFGVSGRSLCRVGAFGVSGRSLCRVGAFGVSGRSLCRVAAFGVSGLPESDFLFITISHCAWRHVISLSKATKKRSKENAFRTRARKLTQRAVSMFLAPQKHGARKSDGCVKPSFSEHGYPHASPPVTEPAQGSPRAIRVNHPSNLYAYRTTSATYLETIWTRLETRLLKCE